MVYFCHFIANVAYGMFKEVSLMKKQLIALALGLTVMMARDARSGEEEEHPNGRNHIIHRQRHGQQPDRPRLVEATTPRPTPFHLSDLNPFTWSYSSLALAVSFTAFCLLIYKKFLCGPVSISIPGCRPGIDFRLSYDNSASHLQPELIFTTIDWNRSHITCNGTIQGQPITLVRGVGFFDWYNWLLH
jgi:hypothetical protein